MYIQKSGFSPITCDKLKASPSLFQSIGKLRRQLLRVSLISPHCIAAATTALSQIPNPKSQILNPKSPFGFCSPYEPSKDSTGDSWLAALGCWSVAYDHRGVYQRMSIMQITATQSSICSNKSACLVSKLIYPSFHSSQSRSAFVNLSANASYFKQGLPVLKYKHRRVGLKHRHTLIVSLFGSKGNESGDGGSPWKAFDKVFENVKKGGRSVEDVLRQQIEKKEFYDGGDGGNRPPSGGGGGGSSSSGDSSSGSEDDNLAGIMEETLQVVLATMGFIFLYIYILRGEELTRLARDYIKYLFGGSKSVRLKRSMYEWGVFYQRLTEKKQYDEYWLEKAILNTPTWWDHPDNYRRTVMAYIDSKYPKQQSASASYDDDDDDDDDDERSDDDKQSDDELDSDEEEEY